MGKPRRKRAQGRTRPASTNTVNWESRARDLYWRGILKLEHLDTRPEQLRRAHRVITDETAQTVSGIRAGQLMTDQMPEVF